jgi:type II secretory ATPase GspE/PulE/Tfp pilus assembly ATPase PilB-like protein
VSALKVLSRLTDAASIKHALLRYQRLLQEKFGALIAHEAGKLAGTAQVPDAALRKQLAQELAVVRIVDALLRHALLAGASDMHLEPLSSELLVRYRINGALHDALALPTHAYAGVAARLKTLAGLDLAEVRAPQDGRFLMETEADRVSLRLSTLPTSHGEKMVLRVLREAREGFTLDVLGFHGEGLEAVHRALRSRSGLVLIAGPRGSGRTTTLYTLLDILATPRANVSTIEDPIEYRLTRVNQTQVNEATGFGYANALRALLRQDPDVVALGELRDAATAALALQAALAGKLVIATLAAESAADAVPRLLDLGVDAAHLASALTLVVGTRLVRKLCDEKLPYTLNAAGRRGIVSEARFAAAFKALQEERILKAGVQLDTVPFFLPKASAGCPEGYAGNLGLQEVLVVSSPLRDFIREGRSGATLEEQAKKEGMLTLLEDGLYKAMRGMTSLEEVARAAQ